MLRFVLNIGCADWTVDVPDWAYKLRACRSLNIGWFNKSRPNPTIKNFIKRQDNRCINLNWKMPWFANVTSLCWHAQARTPTDARTSPHTVNNSDDSTVDKSKFYYTSCKNSIVYKHLTNILATMFLLLAYDDCILHISYRHKKMY